MIDVVLARNRVLGCSWSIVVEYRVMREGFWLLSIDIALRVPIHTNPKANAANPRSHKYFGKKRGLWKGKRGKLVRFFPNKKYGWNLHQEFAASFFHFHRIVFSWGSELLIWTEGPTGVIPLQFIGQLMVSIWWLSHVARKLHYSAYSLLESSNMCLHVSSVASRVMHRVCKETHLYRFV